MDGVSVCIYSTTLAIADVLLMSVPSETGLAGGGARARLLLVFLIVIFFTVLRFLSVRETLWLI